MKITLPTTDELLSRYPSARPGDFVLLLHDGEGGVDMVVPKNFYELPLEQVWAHYLEPAIRQMAALRSKAA